MKNELIHTSRVGPFGMPHQLWKQLGIRLATYGATFRRDNPSSCKVGRTCVLSIVIDQIAKVEGFAFGCVDTGDIRELYTVF